MVWIYFSGGQVTGTPFAYLATPTEGARFVVCPADKDHEEIATVEPMTEADVLGWTEGLTLYCPFCGELIVQGYNRP